MNYADSCAVTDSAGNTNNVISIEPVNNLPKSEKMRTASVPYPTNDKPEDTWSSRSMSTTNIAASSNTTIIETSALLKNQTKSNGQDQQNYNSIAEANPRRSETESQTPRSDKAGPTKDSHLSSTPEKTGCLSRLLDFCSKQ